MAATRTKITPIHEDQEPAEDFAFLLEYDVPKLSLLIARATEIRAEKAAEEKQVVLAELRARMSDYGIEQSDLFGVADKQAAGAPGAVRRGVVAAKYRSPQGDEWSGRGRMPKWLQVAEAEGHKRDEFLIDKG